MSNHLRFAHKRIGFSIIEVLIFTLLVSIVVIGISYTTVFSLRNSRFAQQKTQANAYAQQLQDWLRGQEEVNWQTYVSFLPVGTYCVNALPADISSISSGSCDEYGLSQSFKRELRVVSVNLDQTSLTFKITVSWRDSSNVNTVVINSVSAVPE